jgi:hypothetical protein
MPKIIFNSGVAIEVNEEDADKLRSAAAGVAGELIQVTIQQGNSIKSASGDIPFSYPVVYANPRTIDLIVQ